ncbi:DNA repair protein RecO [Candidatus Saccharibacteria bacterium]|jgi:DNA repair protein RecO (recombination protein O)|nr:DNA repair protein RecO [Candidatus Saccharibacteria bacterium]
MKSETTQAIVLRRTDYGEADRIIQFCTPAGKRTAMARGVRRPKSKLAGGIELLSESDIVLRQGRGDIATLVQARMSVFYKNILADYDRLQFAYEALKHVARVSEIVDEPDWYVILKETLMGLDDVSTSLALIKAWFFVQFSKTLGEELSLWRDIDGEKIKAATNYTYDVSSKGLREQLNGELNENHLKLLRLVSQKPLRIVRKVGGVQEYVATCANVAIRHASLS